MSGLVVCPLCDSSLDTSNQTKVATHMVECGKRFLENASTQNTSSTIKRSKEDVDEEVIDKKATKKQKQKVLPMTMEEYPNANHMKAGRFVRIGEWKGISKATLHRCADSECAREWKPSPSQCLPDDYYCPSCVLHHRNNVDRFQQPRLTWTADVPNTFYVFSLVDPQHSKQLIKFGRTQNSDATKRYPAKELKNYNMKLLLSLRGRLETMTIIENWWKEEATKNDLFCTFSESDFHGKEETLDIDDTTIARMIAKSKEIAAKNKI